MIKLICLILTISFSTQAKNFIVPGETIIPAMTDELDLVITKETNSPIRFKTFLPVKDSSGKKTLIEKDEYLWGNIIKKDYELGVMEIEINNVLDYNGKRSFKIYSGDSSLGLKASVRQGKTGKYLHGAYLSFYMKDLIKKIGLDKDVNNRPPICNTCNQERVEQRELFSVPGFSVAMLIAEERGIKEDFFFLPVKVPIIIQGK